MNQLVPIMWKNVLFTVWFQDFVTVFNQSYNCQTSHYLGRNRLPNACLIVLSYLVFGCTNRNSFPRDLYILTLVCVRRQQGIQKERTSRFGDARGQHTIKSWRIVTFPDFHVQKHPQKTNINTYVKYQPICNTWQWACSFEKNKNFKPDV